MNDSKKIQMLKDALRNACDSLEFHRTHYSNASNFKSLPEIIAESEAVLAMVDDDGTERDGLREVDAELIAAIQPQEANTQKAKHSPAPWRLEATQAEQGATSCIVDANGVVICYIPAAIWSETGSKAFPQMWRDAKLLKSAPELLALVKRWHDWCNNGVQPIAIRRQIETDTRAAIAKVEGGK